MKVSRMFTLFRVVGIVRGHVSFGEFKSSPLIIVVVKFPDAPSPPARAPPPYLLLRYQADLQWTLFRLQNTRTVVAMASSTIALPQAIEPLETRMVMNRLPPRQFSKRKEQNSKTLQKDLPSNRTRGWDIPSTGKKPWHQSQNQHRCDWLWAHRTHDGCPWRATGCRSLRGDGRLRLRRPPYRLGKKAIEGALCQERLPAIHEDV